MLCEACRQENDRAIPDGRRPRDESDSPAQQADVSAQVCERCGAALSAGPGPDLLAKLSQLARFGLAADDGPLLESAKGD